MSATSSDAKEMHEEETVDKFFLLDGPGGAGKTTILTAMQMAVKIESLNQAISDNVPWQELDQKLKPNETSETRETREMKLKQLRTGKDGDLVLVTFGKERAKLFRDAILENIATLTRDLLKKSISTATAAEADLIAKELTGWEAVSTWKRLATESQAEAIVKLWNGMAEVGSINQGLLCNADRSASTQSYKSDAWHFLSKANLIIKKDYSITPEDALRSRTETTSKEVIHIPFVGTKEILVLDAGGQDSRREENHKNPHYKIFKENKFTKFLYVIPIGDFDEKVSEVGSKRNHMDQFGKALDILEELLKTVDIPDSQHARTFIICLNKFDKFAVKADKLAAYEKEQKYPWSPWNDEEVWKKELKSVSKKQEEEDRLYREKAERCCVQPCTLYHWLCQYPCFCIYVERLSIDARKHWYIGTEEYKKLKSAREELMNKPAAKFNPKSSSAATNVDAAYRYFHEKVARIMKRATYLEGHNIFVKIIATTATDFATFSEKLGEVLNLEKLLSEIMGGLGMIESVQERGVDDEGVAVISPIRRASAMDLDSVYPN